MLIDISQGLIEQWIDFAASSIDLAANAWIYPIDGLIPNNALVRINLSTHIIFNNHIIFTNKSKYLCSIYAGHQEGR